MKNHADYEIVRVEDDKVFIVDLDLGNISVTNDASNVYREINNNFPNRRLIYRDTLGNWDEIVINKNLSVEYLPYHGEVPKGEDITGFPSSALIERRKFKLNMMG